MGDRVNGFSFSKKMYGRFSGKKEIGRNDEVAVRRGPTTIIGNPIGG